MLHLCSGCIQLHAVEANKVVFPLSLLYSVDLSYGTEALMLFTRAGLILYVYLFLFNLFIFIVLVFCCWQRLLICFPAVQI